MVPGKRVRGLARGAGPRVGSAWGPPEGPAPGWGLPGNPLRGLTPEWTLPGDPLQGTNPRVNPTWGPPEGLIPEWALPGNPLLDWTQGGLCLGIPQGDWPQSGLCLGTSQGTDPRGDPAWGPPEGPAPEWTLPGDLPRDWPQRGPCLETPLRGWPWDFAGRRSATLPGSPAAGTAGPQAQACAFSTSSSPPGCWRPSCPRGSSPLCPETPPNLWPQDSGPDRRPQAPATGSGRKAPGWGL